MSHILIVDDEHDIIEVVKRYLEKEGHTIHIAHNGIEALTIFERNPIDLIITDIMMPQMDGYEFMDEVLQHNEHIPFMFISAKTQESDKIYSLTLGADDFITKPFSPRELTLRVKNLLRRVNNTSKKESCFTVSHFTVDELKHQIMFSGEELSLSLKEFQLLVLFLSNIGRVFSKSELFERIWDTDYIDDANTLNVHIHSLRDKLDTIAGNRPYPHIKTVWGLGYRMEEGL